MKVRTTIIALCSVALLAGAFGCAKKESAKADAASPAENGAEETKPAETPKKDEAASDKKDEGQADKAPAEGEKKDDAADNMAGNDLPPASYEHPGMLDPAQATETAPDSFKVKFTTTVGDFVIEAKRDWSPNGVDRLFNLVKIGYYKDVAFFRVISGFMVQFGIHGDPRVNTVWRDAKLKDDPVKESNKPGYVTFAMAGPDTRTSQLFINFGDNSRLDGMKFSPIAKVVEGMEVVNKIYSGYGEGAPRGRGPSQGLMQSKGNSYLKEAFPKMDYIKNAEIVQ